MASTTFIHEHENPFVSFPTILLRGSHLGFRGAKNREKQDSRYDLENPRKPKGRCAIDEVTSISSMIKMLFLFLFAEPALSVLLTILEVPGEVYDGGR